MQICFIGNGLKSGGQERHLSGLANYYATNGHKVVIINLFRTEHFFETDKSIQIYWPNIERKNYHKLLYAALMIPYLRKNIKKIKPDFVLCFGEWYSPFTIISTIFLNVPLYLFELMGPQLKLGFLIDTARKLFYKYADGVIVQTNTAAEIVSKKTHATNIVVIPNPLNVINSNTSIKKKQIVSVGRLSHEKGHIILIRAFARLPQNDWSLHIIGDGTERQNLEAETAELNISSRVFFYGYQKDFHEIMGESEIFVLPSYYEGFPNALLEAMSVPLACISTNCIAGPSDIIENGKNGLLVEPGNILELVKAIELLILNKDLRKELARNAYKVREKYQFDKIAQQYIEFITRNIGAK